MANSILLLTTLAIIFICPGYGYQTTCSYPSYRPSPTCGRVIRNHLNQDEKDRIVNLHNSLRHNVYSGNEKRGYPSGPQPRARYETFLTWDENLAAMAQKWANQCIFGHGQCEASDRFGQSIGYDIPANSLYEEVTVESFVSGWYDEVAKFNKDNVASYDSKPNNGIIQHYTNIVWSNTTKIGCGYIRHEIEGGARHRTLLVCNYSPQGNIPGQPVY